MARILVVGMNPAWQTVMTLPALRLGGVVRASESQSLASGKGINCARLLARMGHDITLMQVLAGERGRHCLEACEKAGLRSLHVWAEGETRQCLTLIDASTRQVTEIIEPFAVDYRPAWGQSLMRQVTELGTFDAAIWLGSLPNGWDGRFYADLLGTVRADVRVLDTLQGLTPEALAQVQWVKVNHEEWEAFLRQQGGPNAEPLRADVLALITRGGEPARVECEGRVLGTVSMPILEVLNPIGAGDTVSAGLVHHVLMGRSMQQAVLGALSMGAASCLEILPAHYRPEVAESLRRELQWQNAG